MYSNKKRTSCALLGCASISRYIPRRNLRIFQKDSFELFKHLDSVEDESNNSYLENQAMVNRVFVQLECAVEKRLDS